MKNSKVRRIIATAMASIMVLGSSMSVFAEDAVSGNTAGVSGNGTSTGHVDRAIVNVAWPVEVANDTTFDYIMDAEGLVRETASINAVHVTIPDEADDTGVYFGTATDATYANYSAAKEVKNKSSISLNISATAVPSVSEGTMVALAGSQADIEAEGDTPILLLELAVGDKKGSISTNKGVTVTKTVSGCSANYAVKNTTGTTYVYEMIDSPDDTKWATASISLNGATRKVKDVGSVKAPKITVTWSYAKTDAPVPVDAAVVEVVNTTVNVTLVSGVKAVAANVEEVKVDDVVTTTYSITGSGKVAVANVPTTTGSHTILITYDGTVYKATYTK
jgi:hypothetical protein